MRIKSPNKVWVITLITLGGVGEGVGGGAVLSTFYVLIEYLPWDSFDHCASEAPDGMDMV